MSRLYPDMSISEVKILLNMIDSILINMQHKSINNPFRQEDYKKLYQVIEAIQKVSRSRWIKEFY